MYIMWTPPHKLSNSQASNLSPWETSVVPGAPFAMPLDLKSDSRAIQM